MRACLLYCAAALAAAVTVAVAPATAQADCAVGLGGGQTASFDACITVPNVGSNFLLSWNQPSNGTITWGMSTTSDRWVLVQRVAPS